MFKITGYGVWEGGLPLTKKETANYYDVANRCPTNVYNRTNVGEF